MSNKPHIQQLLKFTKHYRILNGNIWSILHYILKIFENKNKVLEN